MMTSDYAISISINRTSMQLFITLHVPVIIIKNEDIL